MADLPWDHPDNVDSVAEQLLQQYRQDLYTTAQLARVIVYLSDRLRGPSGELPAKLAEDVADCIEWAQEAASG